MNIPVNHIVVEPPPFESPPFTPDCFAGQTVVVTGGGSGMGLAMATAFGQGGAKVALLGRTAETLEKGVATLTDLGIVALGIQGDVRNPEAIASAFDMAERELGPVTLLANNAGGNYPVLAEAMSPGQWRSITRIAIDGTFFVSAEFARRRIAAGGGGAIVNNSAQYVWSGFPGDAHSAAAKAAIVTMTVGHAADWKPHAIRVNCVAAGFFPHERSNAADDAEAIARLGAMFPLGRVGRIREFGWVSAFLCSHYASGVTGETLVIDGGDRLRRQLMSPAFVPPRERESIWGVAP